MEENKNLEEVEIFSSTDDFIVSQVCAVLEKNDIKYIKEDDGIGGYHNIYFGKSYETKRVIIAKENYDKAMTLINNIIETGADITEEELPEELRDIDESYFEDLAKKGKITSYIKKDGSKVEYISKREFEKKLKKEKDEIMKDQKIFNILLFFIIPLIILEIWRLFNVQVGYGNLLIRTIIYIIALVPACIINVNSERKIKRMYIKYKEGKEYKNSEERMNTKLLITIVIISSILLLYSLIYSL